MKFIKLKINNQYLIVPKLFKDKRGIFNRSYCLETLKKKTEFYSQTRKYF